MSLTKVTYSMIDSAPINVLDFGAVGDGVADDSSAFQQAVNFSSANKRKLYVPSGTYLIGTEVAVTNHYDICIEGDPTSRPVLLGSQALANAGSSIFSFTSSAAVTGLALAANIKPNERDIVLSSVSQLSVGMGIRITSNVLWPYDNRGVYFKGEIHEILKIDSNTNTITVADSTRDSYATSEIVAIEAWEPNSLTLKNLSFFMPLPDPSASSRGVTFNRTKNAIIENCAAEGMEFYAFQTGFCFNTIFSDIQFRNLRGTSNGYGVSDRGSLGTRVSGLYAYACRRAYDSHSFTGVNSAPNRDAIVERFEIYGGGDLYPDQPLTTQFRSNGLGMHGPSEGVRFMNGFVRDLADAFKVRGKNTVIQNVNFINQLGFACIEATYGVNLVVQNCVADWDNYPNKVADLSAAIGGVPVFVEFGGGDATPAWNWDSPTVISDNVIYGGTETFVLLKNMSSVKYLSVNNNVIQAYTGASGEYNIVRTEGVQAFVWKSSFIGNVVNALTGSYNITGDNVSLGNSNSTDIFTGVHLDNRSQTVYMQQDTVHALRFDMDKYESSGGTRRPIFLVATDVSGVVMFQIRKEEAVMTQLVGSVATWVATADGESLTGTTGTVGDVTFGLMNDGRLYIENRTAIEESYRVTLLA
jgi:hypothetical protein